MNALNARGIDPNVKATALRGMTALELATTVFPEQRWAVTGLIPEGLTIFSGNPKVGKSWWALELCLAVGSGSPFLGFFHTEPGEVLCLAFEDSQRRIQERMVPLLAGQNIKEDDLDRIRFETGWPRMGSGGMSSLEAYMQAHPALRLVVVDTFAKFRQVTKPRNSNAYEVDYEQAERLKSLADKYNVAVLVIHHLRKAAAEDIHATLSGSQGLPAAADSSIVIERSRGSNTANLHVTGRDIEEETHMMTWKPETLRWTMSGSVIGPDINPERAEVLDLLKQAVSPLSPQNIADKLGKARPAVSHLLGKLEQQGLIRKVAYGRYEARLKSGPKPSGNLHQGALVQNPPYTAHTAHSSSGETSVSAASSVSGMCRNSFKPSQVEVARAMILAAEWSVKYGPGFNRSALYRALEEEGVRVSSVTNFSSWLKSREKQIQERIDAKGVDYAKA